MDKLFVREKLNHGIGICYSKDSMTWTSLFLIGLLRYSYPKSNQSHSSGLNLPDPTNKGNEFLQRKSRAGHDFVPLQGWKSNINLEGTTKSNLLKSNS